MADEHYPLVAFPDIGPAFQERKMDAAFAPEPFVTSLEETYGVQELADLDQGSTTNFPIQGMVTTASWAQRNPNTLAAFLRAYNEGQVIATTERAKVEQVLETFLHLPGSVAALVALPAFPRGVDPVRLQRVVSAMLRFGILGPQFEQLQRQEHHLPRLNPAADGLRRPSAANAGSSSAGIGKMSFAFARSAGATT